MRRTKQMLISCKRATAGRKGGRGRMKGLSAKARKALAAKAARARWEAAKGA